jgi:FkbM family methyltransferase
MRTPTSFFKILKLIERIAAFGQGKGYGTASIQQEVKLIQGFLTSEPKIAIDIGGNVGAYTAELRRTNHKLEIHIFEPSSTNIKNLNEKFKNDPLIYVIPNAVSDTNGEAVLFSDRYGSGLGSLTRRRLDHFNIAFDMTEKVKSIRFEDYWINNLNSRELDLVKIDIEGHEFSALHGFGEAIKLTKAIQFEFGGCNIDTRTFFQDFWYYFKHHNFDIYRITPLGPEHIRQYSERDEFFSTTNYIAVRR